MRQVKNLTSKKKNTALTSLIPMQNCPLRSFINFQLTPWHFLWLSTSVWFYNLKYKPRCVCHPAWHLVTQCHARLQSPIAGQLRFHEVGKFLTLPILFDTKIWKPWLAQHWPTDDIRLSAVMFFFLFFFSCKCLIKLTSTNLLSTIPYQSFLTNSC